MIEENNFRSMFARNVVSLDIKVGAKNVGVLVRWPLLRYLMHVSFYFKSCNQ